MDAAGRWPRCPRTFLCPTTSLRMLAVLVDLDRTQALERLLGLILQPSLLSTYRSNDSLLSSIPR